MTDPIPELISIVLHLQPVADDPPGLPVPSWWGHAAYTMLLDVIRSVDEGLAAGIHDSQAPSPCTASNLLGVSRNGLKSGEIVRVRLTGFSPAASKALYSALQPGGRLVQGNLLEIDRRILSIQQADWQPGTNPWAGAQVFSVLSAPYLLAGSRPDRYIQLEWSSPTAFRSAERHVPLPLPELVFGSLLDRWNLAAPRPFPEEVRRYAQECLAINRFDMETRNFKLKEGASRNGAVGTVRYTTLNYDRYWMGILHTLAEFSFYSGLGSSASMGMGQCRKLE